MKLGHDWSSKESITRIISLSVTFVRKSTHEPVREKTNNLGSDQARHKLGCTVTEDGQRLEILDLESRGIVLSEWRKQRC